MDQASKVPLVLPSITSIVSELSANLSAEEEARDDSSLSNAAVVRRVFGGLKTTLRNYQIELVLAAIQENLIAVLPTGSGKTMVAISMVYLFKQANPDKAVAFVVDKIPLVHQQANAFRQENSVEGRSLKVLELSGSYKSTEDRDTLTSGNFDVLFCTADILRNHLAKKSGSDSIGWFSLLVLDEIHHVCGNHPYLKLLSEHYLVSSPSTRPRLLGLTASPVSGGSSINDIASSLNKKMKELMQDTQAQIYKPIIFQDSINPMQQAAERKVFEATSGEEQLFQLACSL